MTPRQAAAAAAAAASGRGADLPPRQGSLLHAGSKMQQGSISEATRRQISKARRKASQRAAGLGRGLGGDFQIFVEDEFGGGGGGGSSSSSSSSREHVDDEVCGGGDESDGFVLAGRSSGWSDLPSRAAMKKENERRPSRWNEAAPGDVGAAAVAGGAARGRASRKPSFELFVDPGFDKGKEKEKREALPSSSSSSSSSSTAAAAADRSKRGVRKKRVEILAYDFGALFGGESMPLLGHPDERSVEEVRAEAMEARAAKAKAKAKAKVAKRIAKEQAEATAAAAAAAATAAATARFDRKASPSPGFANGKDAGTATRVLTFNDDDDDDGKDENTAESTVGNRAGNGGDAAESSAFVQRRIRFSGACCCGLFCSFVRSFVHSPRLLRLRCCLSCELNEQSTTTTQVS